MTRSSKRSRSSWGDGSGTAEAGSPIPEDKRYFRIGEVSRIVGVEPYVLRYWEGEFPRVRPARADSNQRTYQRKDLELLLEIKRLLYEERLTIKGARKRLQSWRPPEAEPSRVCRPDLDEIRRELHELLRILS